MTEIKQKARFKGKKGQIFNIGAKSFASDIWRPITQDEIDAIKKGGMIAQFEFSPPVDFSEKPAVVDIKDVVEKPRKKRKSKKKEGDK